MLVSLVLLLSACGTDKVASLPRTPTSAPVLPTLPHTAEGSLATPATSTRQAGPTPTELPETVLIWWPAALYPVNGSPAEQILTEQLDEYRLANGKTITLRVKRNDGLGGIYETLRSGSVAAPSVMPDLALMRRDDLVQAVSSKLVEPVDSDALAVDDLYASGLALGKINGVQYGIPYSLEIEHAAYRSTALTNPPHTLDDLIATGQTYLFPAGVTKGVNTALLAQYISAGGRIADEKGTRILDVDPLRTVLHYYEQAVAAKLAGPSLLDYTSPTQYWPLLTGGKTNMVQVNSTMFLAQHAALPAVNAAPLPLPSNTIVTPLNGWLWVVTTTNVDRQTRALDVLAWLLRTDHQGQFTQTLGVLPSRRSALASWVNIGSNDNETSYAKFAGSLLEQVAAPPTDTIDPDVAAALQKAFEDVISARKSADTAANDAVTQISQSK
ncbi:MAG: extracellular solute-binding protein [Chloroflexota bacterium]